MFHSSDRPKGKSVMNPQSILAQAGGLESISEIHTIRRSSLTIGKTVAHRGVGRSAPIPFVILRRNLNGDGKSGGFHRLGPVSTD